jgi:hypothetical protein
MWDEFDSHYFCDDTKVIERFVSYCQSELVTPWIGLLGQPALDTIHNQWSEMFWQRQLTNGLALTGLARRESSGRTRKNCFTGQQQQQTGSDQRLTEELFHQRTATKDWPWPTAQRQTFRHEKISRRLALTRNSLTNVTICWRAEFIFFSLGRKASSYRVFSRKLCCWDWTVSPFLVVSAPRFNSVLSFSVLRVWPKSLLFISVDELSLLGTS